MNQPDDPQLDTNFLIRLQRNEPEFLAYARANRAAGLSYSPAAQTEFVASAPAGLAQLQALEQQYGIRLVTGIPLSAIDSAGARLQNAFQGDPLHRVLHLEDARVAAAAFLANQRLATGDLPLFKRARDLGIAADFVGSGAAAARAAAYVPRPVPIPPP
jgi:predicted nucleic acid-binding protein